MQNFAVWENILKGKYFETYKQEKIKTSKK